MADVVIDVRGIGKRYQVFQNPHARLLHAIWPGWARGMEEVWALRDIDFQIRRGESVAIIGRNGGGKSTLLEILTGTLKPTCGEVEVKGRVSALLELGSGFNPEYTGRQNVVLSGLLQGLSRQEIMARFDEIEAFAEIGAAIERPVKTYSTGMVMRLAFAVQILCSPDILIIDEALSVGDFFFQQKCLDHIRKLHMSGMTLVFVSHDMGTVRDLCGRALYLKKGRLCYSGETQKAIRAYLSEVPTSGSLALASLADGERSAIGDGSPDVLMQEALWSAPARADGSGCLLAVGVSDAAGNPAVSFPLGSRLRLCVAYVPGEGEAPHVSVEFRNRYNQIVTSLGSSRLGLQPPVSRKNAPLIFEMTIDMLLEAGNYSITINLGVPCAPNRGRNIDSTPALGPLSIVWDYENERAPFLGMAGLPNEGAFRVPD